MERDRSKEFPSVGDITDYLFAMAEAIDSAGGKRLSELRSRLVSELKPGDPVWAGSEVEFVSGTEPDAGRIGAYHVYFVSHIHVHSPNGLSGFATLPDFYAGSYRNGKWFVPTPVEVARWLDAPENQGLATELRSRFPERYGNRLGA